ncbi:hypothetical protein BJV77DRAFT_683546 [Russula vinacea]|nr:hypothetical protein BJV77DRAFT_683546 [Russula vinacea]
MSGIQLERRHLPLPTVLRAIITRYRVTPTHIPAILLIMRIRLHCPSQARLYRSPIFIRLHRNRNRSHSNILPISLRIQLKGPQDLLEFFHQADIQLRSLPLKYRLKSIIPNTILNRTHRHNNVHKYNIALGSKRSLKGGNLVALTRLTQSIIITPSLTSRHLALRHLANHISRLQALHHHLIRTSPLKPLPRRFRCTIQSKAHLRSHMPGHTLRARALSRPLDHTPPAQALALPFRPPINTPLLRAPFLLLNNMQLLQSSRIPHL